MIEATVPQHDRLGSGNDTYIGTGFTAFNGFDIVRGGTGNDRFIVSSLQSIYSGDGGNDRLTGNADPDGFLFRVAPTSANADVITDFNSAQDVIGLSAAIFPGLPVGRLDGSRLSIGPAATNSGHRVIYDSLTGQVFFDGDSSGTTQAPLICTIPVNLDITPPNIEVF